MRRPEGALLEWPRYAILVQELREPDSHDRAEWLGSHNLEVLTAADRRRHEARQLDVVRAAFSHERRLAVLTDVRPHATTRRERRPRGVRDDDVARSEARDSRAGKDDRARVQW